MGDDSEWIKLPTDEKVQHKVWKARLAGYEEAIKLFRTLDEKSPEFNKFAPLVRKFVVDSNAVAQEKALEAVIVFVENASVATKVAQEVAQGVVQKCLSASKQKTKENGKEIIMLYIEAEKQDVVSEAVLEGWTNKNPKVVSACVQVMREALRNFGNKIVQIKPMVKFLPKLLDDRDKNVREETKLLVIEMYRWAGAAIKPKLSDFKPLQVAELEAEFEKLQGEKAQQVRFLRSQQDLKAKMEEKAAMAEAGVESEEEAEDADDVDPYELLEPVNILAGLPKDYYDKIEAKKWQERKEALEAVQKLVENPKIEPGDHGALVKTLLKVIGKDSNVMLVALSAKCMTGLANGLRKKFAPYAPQAFQVYLEKFKEKKLAVVTALREAADAAYLSVNLEALMEEILAALENRNPQIKAETASFIARAFSRLTLTTLPKKQLKAFCTSLLKTVNDTAPDVREASFLALGTAMKVVTEKNIMAYLADVDNIKMQKIKECSEKAVLLNAKGEPRSSSGGAATKKPAAPASASSKSATAGEDKSGKKTGGPPAASARPKTAPAKSSGGGTKASGAAKVKPAAKASVPAEERTEKLLSDEAVLEKATELFGEEMLAQLDHANWKERLAGMETMTTNVKRMTRDMIPCQVCVRTIAKKPGFKDNNFQVLKLRIELISHLAQNADFTKVSAEHCIPDLVEKVGDVKNGQSVQEAFSYIAEATSLDFVAGEVIKLAFKQKNPKNQSEAVNWMTKSVTEFGLVVQVKPHLENIKKAFAATNPAVRQSALGLLTVLYQYMGPKLRVLFDGEKPALLQQIDAEFEKVKDLKPPAPVRGMRADDEDDDDDAGVADDGGAVEEEDLVPRTDVGEKFTDELIESLSDKNWKVRGEGLQKIITILKEAKFITSNLGSLPEALKARLGDSNKNLITTTIGICATLATSMGRGCQQHVKVIGPPLIACLGDLKPALRAAALGALNAWVDHTTLTPLVEAEALSDALKLENPNLRQELLGWLIERLPNHKPLPRDEMRPCVPPLLSCLEDRNGDVRKKAQEALVPFMIQVGYESVFKATSKLKPASKDQIMQIIEKAKENLPAKQPKKKPAAPAKASVPAKKAVAAPVVDESVEDKENSPPAQPPAKNKTKTKGTAAPSKKKKVEEDTSPPISMNEPKEKRFKDEKTMKCLKWNFKDPKPEYVEQLRTSMEKNFSKTMMEQMFHSDFKFHTKAIETLIKCLESCQTEQLANLDLILKWFTLRFFDTNPSMLNKALEYLQMLFKQLIDTEYSLHDYEATAFVPYLVIKVGENKDNVRRDVRAIFKLLYKLYPASKMYVFISDGIKSKNTKQKTECLEELGYLIEQNGINICEPSPQVALKLIASQISERDNSVRNAALNSTVVAYQKVGDNLYKYIGTLKEKDQGYLDERIKRTLKSKPPATPQRQPSKADRPKTAPQPQGASSKAQTASTAAAGPVATASSTQQPLPPEYQINIGDNNTKDSKPLELGQIDDQDIDKALNDPIAMPHCKYWAKFETKSTVNDALSQLSKMDISSCTQALAQVDKVMNDEGRVCFMEGRVDELLQAVSLQLKVTYTTHMADADTPKKAVMKLYRCLIATLVTLYKNSKLAAQGSKNVLRGLIHNLVTVLLDTRLSDVEEGAEIKGFVNKLCVKIIEKSDATNAVCALIRLLQDCLDSPMCSEKFLEVIMKCVWKLVRQLPDNIAMLQLDQVLHDVHVFLRTFPSTSWKDRASDMPLRTVKTILHTIVQLKGNKIFAHLFRIDPSEHSEVKVYIEKYLRHKGDNTDMNGNEKCKPSEQEDGKEGKETMNGDGDAGQMQKSSSIQIDKSLARAEEDYMALEEPKYYFDRLRNLASHCGLEDNIDFYQKPAAKITPFEDIPDFMEWFRTIRLKCELEEHPEVSSPQTPASTTVPSTTACLLTSPKTTKPEPKETYQPSPLKQESKPLDYSEEKEIPDSNKAQPSYDVSQLKARLDKIKQHSNT